MPANKLDPRLYSLLACPACHGTFEAGREELRCASCGHLFALQKGVPVFRSGAVEIAIKDHASNPLGPEFEAILREGKDSVLNIGAGATATRYPNCVEFEHKIFRHTDVVGDAHQLPFRDGVFDRVFAFNVFEHLREPKIAALEILRVLKPGAIATIHTAFLQALHEAPQHFYNATEFGAREWFSSFEIEVCHVSGNFGPGMMLSFLLSSVLDAAAAGRISEKELIHISDTTLGEWANFWRHRIEQPPGFQVLQNLPQEFQGRVAAGFELTARKPIVTR